MADFSLLIEENVLPKSTNLEMKTSKIKLHIYSLVVFPCDHRLNERTINFPKESLSLFSLWATSKNLLPGREN